MSRSDFWSMSMNRAASLAKSSSSKSSMLVIEVFRDAIKLVSATKWRHAAGELK